MPSVYEKYDETCKTYDNARRAMDESGLRRAIEQTAKSLGKSLKELRVLDAGCGTGNYLDAISDLPCQFTGFDGSSGMINAAKAKLSKFEHINVAVEDLTDIKYEDNSFDFIMTTQVLHHLQAPNKSDETKEPEDWSIFEKVMSEFGRLLGPGGSYWCQTSTPEQQMNGFWWSSLVPRAVRIVGVKFPTLERLTKTLELNGFTHFESYMPPEPLMAKELYLDIKGPFNQAFRNCDSSWRAVSADELKSCHEQLQKIIDEGKVGDFFEQREAVRAKVGQTTTFIAHKPAA
eukprot:CAMPEP_0175101902 /NCGR_PEP_ID=MMETSP0086_2-20121207/8098_1 /TAXON_ID=136419 /ORGANISM="Unknown Unknown, Strain D1" /LENGTH=288 /DNA_ID=CAMNT_0016376571 /DNA_START=101 /DNA_END=967 /DNA_ORIENTATION=+